MYCSSRAWEAGGRTGRVAQYIGCIYFIFAFFQGRWAEPSSTTKTDWALWPYLEQVVRERTDTLIQLNETLRYEITERKMRRGAGKEPEFAR